MANGLACAGLGVQKEYTHRGERQERSVKYPSVQRISNPRRATLHLKLCEVGP